MYFCMYVYVCLLYRLLYCMYVSVLHVSVRLAILAAKNTGKYMQYNTDMKYMHDI
jgi:hypothetical protein